MPTMNLTTQSPRRINLAALFTTKRVSLSIVALFALQSVSGIEAAESNIFSDTNWFATGTRIDTDVNVQGFGGLINVPSAHAINYGELHWTWSTLSDNGKYSTGKSDGLYQDGNVLTLTASPFPGLEATIRNSGGDFDTGSDLQANLKYQATFIPEDWFSLAAGYQDVSGITNHLDSYFVVASKDWQNFRFTVGAGKRESERLGFPNRYEGGFYGIQYQPYEWLQLQAEHDGVNNAAALKLKTPKAWFDNQLQLYGSIIAGDYDAGTGNDAVFFQMGLRANLFQGTSTGLDEQNYETQNLVARFGPLMVDQDYGTYTPTAIDFTQSEYYDDNVMALTQLKNALDAHGFENVWVGARGTQLFVRIENSMYNRNQMDAIGVALGMTLDHLPSYMTEVDFTLSRYDIPTLRLVSTAKDLRAFYSGETHDPQFIAAVPIERKEVLADWVGGKNTPWFTPRLKLYPILPNFIGTEIGQADINLAVRANLHVPLWKGGEVFADYDINVSESEDFRAGGPFWKYRKNTGLKNLFLRQTYQLPYNVYVSAGVGFAKQQYLEEHNVATFQAGWQSIDGRHRLSYHYGYLQSRLDEGVDRYIYTGQYRHYLPELDVSMYVEGGQFWRGDRGYAVGLSTHLGDALLSVFMSETDVSIKGVGFTIPLGTRKNMAPSKYGFQVRPGERWSYSLATSSYKGTNQIFVNRAFRPGYLAQMQGRYFDFDRLSLAYINNHLPRLRDAYRTFVRKE